MLYHALAAQGVLNVLEAVRSAGLSHDTRVYQASTSELYGKVAEVPQSETTPFYPRSPYAVSKLFGFWIVKNYRYRKLSDSACYADGVKMPLCVPLVPLIARTSTTVWDV